MASNFDFLSNYWPDMAQIGKTAELYLHADANTCIYKIGLLAERVTQEICSFENIDLPENSSHADRLRALKHADILPKRIDDMLYTLRRARNDAVHSGLDSRERAASLLQLAFHLCCWLMEVYGDWDFTAPEYKTPEDSTQNMDFVKVLQAQEDRITALMAAVEEIRTAASNTSKDDRSEKADQAARDLPLTVEESERIHQDPIRMDVTVLPVINYAMQQNGVALIQSIDIENTTDSEIEDFDIHISSTPEFVLPFSRRIDHLPPQQGVSLAHPPLIINGEYLAGMTEKVSGVLHIELRSGDKVLLSDNVETTILAFDQWQGFGMYTELLPAFVTPNHPELARIIARATEFLGRWTGDTSMDAYFSKDPNRVLRQAAAIFTAIKEEAIAYAVAPASFEQAGQRVRLCDMVLQQKLGNCLDLTLLYVSCLEAVGLYPLLIGTVDHIYTGVWLEEKMFPETVQDDYSLITKRLASGINEIAVVETTCVTTAADRSFDEARETAEKILNSRQTEYIIDVRRARLSRVSPLPQRLHSPTGWEIRHDTSFSEESMSAPSRLGDTIRVDSGTAEENLPKIMQWERKLLDLSLRNTLINLSMSRTQLSLLTNSLDELEDALADGGDFSILHRPQDLPLKDFSFEALAELGSAGIVKAEFSNNRLRSALSENDLGQTIKNLYRAARVAMEENGANSLYLVLGMLRWYESERSTRPRYAPIILLPIEMIRKSAAQGYVIRLRDDEPQMNITLLEKLKQDFGITVQGVDPLPADDHGIDIRRVLTIMRQAVMEQPRWDVLETASIGIFSFSQFVMWNDLRMRSEDLKRNKVVRSLIDGRLCWDARPLEIGERVSEDGILMPMPADASQLHAIRAACSGKSFVLHGPPGTGKSQTITSLIANALAGGRSVLFVAEKMAALNVVQKRLESIGIGPFCLELHSNKSRKKDVLEQLRQASEVTRATTAEAFAARAEQLSDMRAGLDLYVEQLHRTRRCGQTLYALINAYEQYKDAPEIAAFDRAYIRSLDKLALEQQRMSVELMIAAARETGHPHKHPLKRLGCSQYTQSLRSSLPSIVRDSYLKSLESIRGHVMQLANIWGEEQPRNYEDIRKLFETTIHMAWWFLMPPAWSKAAFPQQYFEEITRLTQHAGNADALEAQLLQSFEPGFLTLDGAALFGEYQQVSAQWPLARTLGINKLARLMSAYARVPVNKDHIQNHLTALRDYQQERRAAAELLAKYGQDLGGFYLGQGTNWGQIAELAETAQRSAQALYQLYGSYDVMRKHDGSPESYQAIYGLYNEFGTFTEAKAAFEELLGITQQTEENWIDAQIALCRTILEHTGELREWVSYVAARNQLRSMGLASLVDSYENGAAHDTVLPSYMKAMLQGLIFDAIDASDTLNQFSGAVFNKQIEQYRQMDQKWTELSQQEAYCRLASAVPNFTIEAATSSELGILQRWIRSGGRGVSIRKLFDQIPNLLPRLCPCMLMSPISAAQYLDPGREPFDIVVFDEASQLPTSKAVGVLARGRDAVIVGDPKQMPPTSFFAVNTVDEDNLEAEDLESILDDCLALSMPESHLLWHYRSRHESLIAFSNSQFYDNKLFTFPSVNDRESRVQLVQVDGIFDRGGTRTNTVEAEAVVEEIKRRCQDPELSKYSLGVVTFNVHQQNLIEDLLGEAMAGDTELEGWVFKEDEPLFVKNLENVQGDERDVILFSVGFGPDDNGKIHLNFGPLNRAGGERRLNVAVSRARQEMMVFSSLRPDQLDLRRTQADGVAALRRFLEYAEGRTLALADVAVPARREDQNGIAAAIGRALQKKGYTTDQAVGRSEYRIDIAVVDPDKPDEYILGILLDGSSYGEAKSTRDREIAQVNILSGLGWEIMRVWSMDWWDNRDRELARILQRIQDIQSEVKTSEEDVPALPEEAPKLQGNLATMFAAESAPAPQKTVPDYVAAKLPVSSVSADDLVEPWYEQRLRRKIEVVIAAEAPVSRSLLCRRVVQSCGISRAGNRIQSRLDSILEKMNVRSTTQNDELFYWREDQLPDEYAGLRASAEGDNQRDVRDVAVQEVANAIYLVLHEQFSMGEEDLYREGARKLGYTRLGRNVLSALELGLQHAMQQGGIATGKNAAYVLSELGSARAEAVVASVLVLTDQVRSE